ncbi:MAG: energy-coupling factor transporter ATPase [Firmicutes bacterium]|nr:energy-coupling factor transporter ATPase [Bacillota bacterium]
MIEINDVSYTYEDDPQPALSHIRLQVRPGEWLAVIGANGSGKSTLARMCNGLLVPDQGQVLVDGLDTAKPGEVFAARQKVAFVFQNPDNQFVATTVGDDVAFGPENLGLPPEEIGKRVEDALDAVDLREKMDKPPHLLSGGEKQRVAIAGALAMASRYLVLDEPTSMLDPALRASLLDTLSRLRREKGLALIYITNIMEEAVLADRILVLHEGRVVREGTPRQIFADGQWLRQYRLALPPAAAFASELARSGHPSLQGLLEAEEVASALDALRPSVFPRHPAGTAAGEAAGTPAGDWQIMAENVDYDYPEIGIGKTHALRRISFGIRAGELAAIIGRGGSGKSTLAALLAGLYQPSGGKLTVNGRQAEKHGVFPRVGLVFQYPEQQLFGETVFEEVSYGAKNFGAAPESLPGLVARALDTVGLDSSLLMDKSPFALSGGQKRRVCLAATLVTEPQILILDEPSAGLDEGGRQWLMQLLLQLHAQGKTVIWISHNMDEVAEFAERLLVLDQGRLVADGPPARVMAGEAALHRAGLRPPPLYHLAQALRDRGWPVAADCITLDRLKQEALFLLGGDPAVTG